MFNHCVVKLTGKTKKGKERVKQFGTLWTIETRVDPTGQGRWCVVCPPSMRWVHPTHDADFDVELLP